METEAVGVNTQTQDHNYMQTTPKSLSTKYTNTPTSDMYIYNTSTQRQPMQCAKASKHTNIGSNRFAQTQPMQYSEAGTNTNLPSNRLAQTQPIHRQSTNTPSQNHISTHIDSCKCEEEEIDHTGI